VTLCVMAMQMVVFVHTTLMRCLLSTSLATQNAVCSAALHNRAFCLGPKSVTFPVGHESAVVHS